MIALSNPEILPGQRLHCEMTLSTLKACEGEALFTFTWGGIVYLYNEVHKALVIITGHRCVCPDHQDTINVGQEMDIVTYKKASNGKSS